MLFTEVDLIICPTLQAGSPGYDALGPRGRTGMSSLMGLVDTGYWDCVGNPVLAVPIGFTATGLPLSMQLAAPPFGEGAALHAGQVYQQHTDWHLRQPALVTDAA